MNGRLTRLLGARLLVGVLGAAALLALGPRLIAAAAVNGAFLALNESGGIQSLLADADETDLAETRLRSALELDASSRQAWRGLGFVLNGRQDPTASEAWQIAGDMAGELLQWGHRARQEGDFAQALAWYTQTTRLQPLQTDGFYFSGQVYEAIGSPAQAREAYQQGLQQPTSGTVGAGDFYYRLGVLAAEQPEPDWAAALGYHARALKTDAFADSFTRARALYAQGVAQRRLGQRQEALTTFATLVDEVPDHYWGLVQLGALRWEVIGDSVGATAVLQRAIDLDPSEKRAYLQLGFIEEAQGNWEQAKVLYRQALAIDPQDTEALRRLQSSTP